MFKNENVGRDVKSHFIANANTDVYSRVYLLKVFKILNDIYGESELIDTSKLHFIDRINENLCGITIPIIMHLISMALYFRHKL